MVRTFVFRSVAALILGAFLPTAAFPAIIHACCVEMSTGVPAAASTMDGGEAHAGHGTHAASGQLEHVPEGHGAAEHDGHGPHATHGSDTDGADPFPVPECCSAVCDCAPAGAAFGAAYVPATLDALAATSRTDFAPATVRASPVAFLLPYPNGPPDTAI